MRVLHLSLHFAEYAMSLSRALAKDHQVLLVLAQHNATAELATSVLTENPETMQVATLEDYPLKDPRWTLNAIRLLRIMRQFQPDVVHCQETLKDYLLATLPALRRYPLVLTIHDHKPHSGRDSQILGRAVKYRQWLRSSADAVIVHGEVIRRETEDLLPLLKGRILSIPHGPLGQCADATRVGRPDWEPGQLLFFGRIEAYKGLGVALDALDMLLSKGRSVQLVIAGCGDDLDSYRERIHMNPACILREQFVPASDIAELFRKAHIVVMPYVDATQSGVAAMALTYGRPVVATNVGSLPEFVRHNETGLIAPPMDAAALAAAMEQLLDDPPLAARLASTAARLSQGDLSWDAIARGTAKVYDHAIEHHHKTS